MKKITNFIIDIRNIILVLFIGISVFCLFLGTKVNVNNDMSSYLPKDSQTKIGMNIMDENFERIKESDLYIMFHNLSINEKDNIKKELESINNVESVDYDNTEKYNNGDYTLYILNVEDYDDSKVSKNIYDEVNTKYKDYEYFLGGSINQVNKPIVETWILISAVVFAMIILIFLCNSYIEPFLFLFTIGLAICINSGTNLIFDSVSSITNAISAILQLALSIDYSIMLMNRYTEEKESEKDKVKAMKNALHNAFKSISSSSVTTIVGLLALVFMSFRIGKDLGFVLAKGVFFSLVSIFLCLPGLILLFDKLITKTKKKSVNFKLDKLGSFSYKFRFPCLFIFIALFILAVIFKGDLGILYTGAEQDEIAAHFSENNQMAVIYDNEYEGRIKEYCKTLENNEKIDDVLCYGNTIDEDLKYDELLPKLEDLDKEIDIDEYIIKIIYYYYYNSDVNKELSINEFIKFIKKEVYPNANFDEYLDSDIKKDIDKLEYFATSNSINKKRTKSEISKILNLDTKTSDKLFILYNTRNTNYSIKLDTFINFLNKEVMKDPEYKNMFDKESKTKLNTLLKFTNKNTIKKNMTSKELSNLFGLKESDVNKLLLLYYSTHESSYSLTFTDFVNNVNYLKTKTHYLDNQDVSAITSLVPVVNNKNNINGTKLDKNHLKAYFGSNELVDMIYYYGGLPDVVTFTPQEFVNIALQSLDPKTNKDTYTKLSIMKIAIDDSLTKNKKKYTSKEMTKLLGKNMTSIYALIGNINGYNYKLSPYKFVNLILKNKSNPDISKSLNNTLKELETLKTVMNNTLNNKKYSTKEMSKLLGIDKDKVELLYSMYDIKHLNKNRKISLNQYVTFLNKDVLNNKDYNKNISKSSQNKLKVVNQIMKNTLKNKKYTSKELYNILYKVADDLDKNLLDVLYIYYGSIKNYNNEYTLTIEEFVKYTNDTILNDKKFEDFIDDDKRSEIIDAKKTIKDAKKLLTSDNYSRFIINTTYELETEETFKFVETIQNDLKKNDDEKIYIIGDSPMAYDMSLSFKKELDFIMALTTIAILIVVIFTFKSFTVSAILVMIIECAVLLTMGIMTITEGSVYFIALLIVQSILMGATIDYAIVYTSYYKEARLKLDVEDSLKYAYNHSIHTILTSATILIIVTFIVGLYAEPIAAKICMAVSKGTICSSILVLFIEPSILAVFDKLIIKQKK